MLFYEINCLLLSEICLMLHQVKNMAGKPNVSEKTDRFGFDEHS